MEDASPWDLLAAVVAPALPAVDHLSNRGSANLYLDRVFVGLGPELTVDERFVGLFFNLVRLTDKALREYDAARVLAAEAAKREDEMPLAHVLRLLTVGDLATDHMENCIDATHRALLYAKALRRKVIGPKMSKWPDGRLVARLNDIRDAIAHADEKILKESTRPQFQGFDPSEPHTLDLGESSMTIGGLSAVTYDELVQLLTVCHGAVELVRKTPTGDPTEAFANYRTRTEMVRSVPVAPPPPRFTAS